MCLGELGRVTSVTGASAQVEVGARTATVSLLATAGPVAPGDWLLVHAGFALARLTPEEAADAALIRSGADRERVERRP